MIRHQAIGHHGQAVAVCLLGQQLKVDAAVIVDEEDILPVVAPLGDVVWHTRDYDSGNPRHAVIVPAVAAVTRNR